MENLRCTVSSIRYHCGDNDYSVLTASAEGYPFPVTVVGILPDPRTGAVFSVEGSWEVSLKYGRQFHAERFREELPATAAGIEKYLSSGMIRGIGPEMAKRIVRKFGKDTLEILDRKPESLLSVRGIGKDDPVRLKSGLLYTLSEMSKGAHCFATRGQLMGRASELLGVDGSCMEPALLRLAAEEDVTRDGENFYLPHFYAAETGSAKCLGLLLKNKKAVVKDPERAMQAAMSTGVSYDGVQKEAVRTALSSGVMVLTGGPGTGKTTTVRGIIRAYRSAGCRILLAAPTGRAAKRLSETTGMDAATIHRLLEYSPKAGFQRDWKNPLEGDVLILDECSMVDILLFITF